MAYKVNKIQNKNKNKKQMLRKQQKPGISLKMICLHINYKIICHNVIFEVPWRVLWAACVVLTPAMFS